MLNNFYENKVKVLLVVWICQMGYSNMYWFGFVLLVVSLPKKQPLFYQNSTHILETHKLMTNTCTELPKGESIEVFKSRFNLVFITSTIFGEILTIRKHLNHNIPLVNPRKE